MKLGINLERGLQSLGSGLYNFALIQLERDREKRTTGNIPSSKKIQELENLAFVKVSAGQSAEQELELIAHLKRHDFFLSAFKFVLASLFVASLGMISYHTSSCLSSTFSSKYCIFVRNKVDYLANKSIAEK